MEREQTMSPDNTVLSAKRENAARVLREILERMGIEAEVSAFDDGERVILDAHGPESGLVIGKKGATLDALQYLINRIVSKSRAMGRGSWSMPKATGDGARTR